MEWHLDGWDRTGGRAFVSLRPRNTELFDHDESWGPVAFVGPPSFRPEPVASTSVALAASRAGDFEPRTPPDPQRDELGFPSAEAAADFVRRAFVNAAATRGGDDGAPVVERGPREPPSGGDGEAFSRNEFLQPWSAASLRLAIDKAQSGMPVKFGITLAPSNDHDFTWPAVESGAVQLIGATALGFPGVHDLPAFERWHSSALDLHRAVQELGFWRQWKLGFAPIDIGAQWRFESIADEISGPAEKTGGKPGMNATLFIAWLLSSHPAVAMRRDDGTAEYLRMLRQTASSDNRYFIASEAAAPRDRFAPMFGWPLPYYAGRFSRLRSVGQLLMTFVSAPGDFSKCHPRLIDVVAFAAAILASNTEDRRVDGWRERAAEHWLAGSMPKWVFREPTERLILQSDARHQPAYA